MKSSGCYACGEKGVVRQFRTYCNIVCRILGQAGLGWRLYPYRIVDLTSGVILTTGPHFDLTPKGIAKLQKNVKRLRQPEPEPAMVIPMESQLTHVLLQSPPRHAIFSGGCS